MSHDMKKDALRQTTHHDLGNIVSGAGLTMGGKLVGGMGQYIYLAILSKLLGSSGLGLYTLGVTVLNLGSLFSRLGLDLGIIKFIAQYRGKNDLPRVKGVLRDALILSLTVSSLLALALGGWGGRWLATLFRKPDLAGVLTILVPALPLLTFVMIVFAATQGARRMAYSAIGYHVFLPAADLVLVGALWLVERTNLQTITAAHAAALFAAAVVACIFLLRVFPEFRPGRAAVSTPELIGISLSLLPVLMLNFILMWTDTLMIGYFMNAAAVGIYNIAMKTALMIGLILTAFNSMFAPTISDLYSQGRFQDLQHIFKVVTRWVLTISLSAFMVLMLLAGDILALFGPDFIPGVSPLRILSLAQFLNAAVGAVALMLSMAGRHRLVMYNSVASGTMNIILNYLLIPRYGITGAAVASCASLTTINLIMLLQVRQLMGMHPFSKPFWTSAAWGGLSFCCFFTLKEILSPAPLPAIFFLGGGMCAVYGVMIYFFGTSADDAVIINLIRKKR